MVWCARVRCARGCVGVCVCVWLNKTVRCCGKGMCVLIKNRCERYFRTWRFDLSNPREYLTNAPHWPEFIY